MQPVTTRNQFIGDSFAARHLRMQVILKIFLNQASINRYCRATPDSLFLSSWSYYYMMEESLVVAIYRHRPAQADSIVD